MIPGAMCFCVQFSNACMCFTLQTRQRLVTSSRGRLALELYFSKNVSHLVSQ